MSNFINISVHQLVDFLLRKGDIDDRIFNSSTMEEGSKIHKIYQDAQNDTFLSEVDLKTTIISSNYEIFLHGRADGIILSDPITVEEIKTTNSDLDNFNDINEEWHLGQAQCYAYMYAKEHKLDKINVQLTYIYQSNIKKNLKKKFSYSYYELENIILDLISRYLNFEKILDEKKKKTFESISNLKFPYKLRKGQQKIINFSKKSVESKSNVFVEASTGLGKTLAINYGSLKGSLDVNVDKFVFLTAKNSGFQSAENCLEILRNNGLNITSCEIIAKEKMCINKNHNCNPDDCPYAKDYYSKLNNILLKYVKNTDNFTNSKILEIAKNEKVCPFELALDISNFSQYLIMDYNYIFNPISYLKRLFEPQDNKFHTFLMVDEAHNMIERSREMFSTSIDYLTFLKAKKSYKNIKSKAIERAVEQLNKDFKLFKKFECEESLVLEKIDDDFILHLKKYNEVIKNYCKNHPKYKNIDNKDFGMDIFKFLTIYDLIDEHFRIIYKKEENNFKIFIKCLDASIFIENIISKLNGSIFFSGTLTPINYYKNAILGSESYKSIEISSPYPIENFNLLVNNSISVRYKNRDKSLGKVYEALNTFISAKTGNYIIFTPSFTYLNKLKSLFSKSNFNIFYQEENMNFVEKENFIKNFEENPKITNVGICVLGGSFSEGIDLVDDRLIGVAIIGVGMPTISFDNNLISEYFNSKNLDGFTYSYINPGINKIMQAVGRLIRSETDKGSALLIDDRYLTKQYLDLFKLNWSNYKIVNNDEKLENELKSFYK